MDRNRGKCQYILHMRDVRKEQRLKQSPADGSASLTEKPQDWSEATNKGAKVERCARSRMPEYTVHPCLIKDT